MEVTISIGVRPRGNDDYDSQRFILAGQKLAEAFTTKFGKRYKTISFRAGKSGKKKWIEGWQVETTDIRVLLDAHHWLQSCHIDADANVRMTIGQEANTIVRARWVDLLGDTREVGTAKYQVKCKQCNALDWNNPPNPFPVSEAIVRSPRNELFMEDNAVVVVSQRLYAIFSRLANGEFASGEVTVPGHPECKDSYRWIRPKHFVGDVASEYWSDPCAKCHMPQRRELKYQEYPSSDMLLRDFGAPNWNIARIGEWPFVRQYRNEAQPSASSRVAISGGLFAVLYNEGVKGLEWPEPFYSIDPDEPAIEDRRRFADLHIGKADKIMSRKA